MIPSRGGRNVLVIELVVSGFLALKIAATFSIFPFPTTTHHFYLPAPPTNAVFHGMPITWRQSIAAASGAGMH